MKSFDELVEAIRMPEALWAATACPTAGLSCDERFLLFLDSDKNQRIRVDELKAAVRWVDEMLVDTAGCDEGSDRLKLSRLSDEASLLRESAALVLRVLGAEGSSITLAQVRSSEQALRSAGVNGDGIVAPESVKDEKLAALARRLLDVLPGATNRAGLRGVDAATVAAFRDGKARGLARLDTRGEVFAWGDDSLARAEQVLAQAARLDEYFMQCKLVAAQPEASPLLRLTGDRVSGSLGDSDALSKAAYALPIAPPRADSELRWSELVRGPSHEALEALRRDVFEPLLGARPSLTEADWRSVRARAERARAFREAAESDKVVALAEQLREVDEAQLDELLALGAADLAQRPQLDNLETLEKLILYQRWLLTFANNFMAMPDLYSTKRSALFEQGRLTLDGRLFTLAVQVPDRAAHAALASTNTMCLAYLKLERQGVPAPLEVVVPITAGTSAGITVGKRGVFYDTRDNEYDATITQVVIQPVSLWEAMTLPFRRVGQFVSSKVQAFGERGDKNMETKLAAAPAVPPAPAAAPAAAPQGALGGTIAGGGLAFAAMGSAVAFIINQLKEVTILDLVRVFIAITLLVMIPSGVLGWLKLRRRNLAVLLEGSGWALNDRLMLTRPLGKLFTRRPLRPAGSRVDLSDLVPKIKSDDSDEDSGARGALVALLIFGIVMSLAWQFRGPIVDGAKWLLPPPAASSAAPATSAAP